MKYIGQIGLISLIGIIGVVFAWSEPTANPPNDNVATPLNVGSGRQTKAGDITVNNLAATSITLGGDTRFAWPGGGGAGCSWQGQRCSCKDVDNIWIGGRTGGTEKVRVVIGATCNVGVLTDVGIISIASEACPNPNTSSGQQKISSWGCDYYGR